MFTNSVPIRGLKPWGNPYHMTQGPGYQMNWARVSSFFAAGKQIVKANGAASIGADALTVDALPFGIRQGETIDFGVVETVVVTLSGNEAIGQTDLSVTALTGPIPAGTLLDFGTGEQLVKLTAAAAAGAVLIIVEALTIALETGDTATYQGGKNTVEATADVLEGAVSVPITNLEFAIADNAEGVLQREGLSSADKFVPEATVMAVDKTTTPYTQIPARDADTEEANHFLASDASNARQASSHSRSGYGTVNGNTFIYENLCPDADSSGDLPAAFKTQLIANAHFKASDFVDYVDTRA